MNYYKLVIAYDGTRYCGWQEQKDRPSIVSVLKKSFTFFCKKNVVLLGASRTDAGVHALGQIARCKTDITIDPQKLCRIWNNVLPTDIMIRKIEAVDDSFNPYYNVEQKTYYYHFFVDRPLPYMARYGWYYPYAINFDTFKKALNFFTGTYDFRSFRCAEDKRENTVRTVDAITLEYLKRFKLYRITIKGQKFMRHMIRRMVGASLAIASQQNGSLALLREIMAAKNSNHPLINAPAHGLLLYRIAYKKGKR